MQPFLSYKDYLKNKDLCIITNDQNLGSVKSLLNYTSQVDYLKYKNCRRDSQKLGSSAAGMSYIPAPVMTSAPISISKMNKIALKAAVLAMIEEGLGSNDIEKELAEILAAI